MTVLHSMPSSVDSISDAMASLSADSVSLSQQHLDVSMAFCQGSCPFKASLCITEWMRCLAKSSQ